jgi:hypothetical protein
MQTNEKPKIVCCLFIGILAGFIILLSTITYTIKIYRSGDILSIIGWSGALFGIIVCIGWCYSLLKQMKNSNEYDAV